MKKIKAKVWRYPGPTAWYFTSVPKKDSVRYRQLYADMHGGWGSLPVYVSIGGSKWKTSIFYSAKDAAYFLPLKKSVRQSEGIAAGQIIEFNLEILV